MTEQKNSGRDFESYVQYVYSTLLNSRGERIQVSRRTTFRLPSGESYEIDIYYEFYKAGVRHRVAIECKDWKRPIDQGKVLEFHQKIKNIGNDIVGVVISRSGFQSGVDIVAARHNILLLTGDDLPSLAQLVGRQIISNALHEPGMVGEPFWVIARRGGYADGLSDGTYYAAKFDEGITIPLFVSKRYADLYLNNVSDRDLWDVFGLPQYKFKVFLNFVKLGRPRLATVLTPPDHDGAVYARAVTVSELERDFLTI
ncbi:restriction endonuclease [Pseudomonas fragariae (ex Marin et al. 2024)]|uniref:restriction endonuclease n=1 Tax=Pseudomonas TaxID=286 RepID=UPI0002099625|nr:MULTISPECIES: restriction endonuclease [Pseudomonas]AKF43754.1 Restriction endonuclease [Pseudomonas syringae pv. syringae B301D]EGH72317.1 hypothetical protein PSYAR_17310 [Pseudomonas syringae pv. aceris str. M302273]EXL29577.1 hypothetical protein PssB301D_04164 [Pseudomonas syringae pv. syringae str. B301D-R]RXT90883.1 hypothetical protein B1F69_15040 [Pseudomonas syringae]BBN61001.1 hypothetical protein KUIN1_01910 [Pseudomonas sp. KUIN-1]